MCVFHSKTNVFVKEISHAQRYCYQDSNIQPESDDFSKQLIQFAILRREVSSPNHI